MEKVELIETLNSVLTWLTEGSIELGKKVIIVLIVYFVARLLISWTLKLCAKGMERRKIELTARKFLMNLIKTGLYLALIVIVVSVLGVEATSIAALLASAGLAIGMALSGTLQNFAGGIMLLVFRPFKVGDFVEAQGQIGTVKEIGIVNTTLTTVDNKIIFIPNGGLSTNVMINYSYQENRRVDWKVSVEYGQNFEKAKAVIKEILEADARILKDPEMNIFLGALADSSVDISIRAWVNSADYWPVFFEINQKIYETFNKVGIGFPFPQLTVHQAKESNRQTQ